VGLSYDLSSYRCKIRLCGAGRFGGRRRFSAVNHIELAERRLTLQPFLNAASGVFPRLRRDVRFDGRRCRTAAVGPRVGRKGGAPRLESVPQRGDHRRVRARRRPVATRVVRLSPLAKGLGSDELVERVTRPRRRPYGRAVRRTCSAAVPMAVTIWVVNAGRSLCT